MAGVFSGLVLAQDADPLAGDRAEAEPPGGKLVERVALDVLERLGRPVELRPEGAAGCNNVSLTSQQA